MNRRISIERSSTPSTDLLVTSELGGWVCLLLWLVLSFGGAAIADTLAVTNSDQTKLPVAEMPAKHRAFFKEYCLDCHDSDTKEGGVDLEKRSFEIDTIPAAEQWQKVLGAVNAGEMPPEDAEQPPSEAKADFLADLSAQMVLARKVLSDTGGVTTMRRLNRREYVNTMRALLGIEVDAADLPDDANAGGFDTAGSSLFFSSDQFEQYVKIARRALDSVIVAGPRPKERTVRREAEKDADRKIGARRDKLTRKFQQAQQWRAQKSKPPSEFGFIDADRVKFEEDAYRRNVPSYKKWLEHPLASKGAILATYFAGPYVDETRLPRLPGEYIIRARVGAVNGASNRFLEYGEAINGVKTGEIDVHGCREISGDKPQVLEFRMTLNGKDEFRFALRERQPNSAAVAKRRFRAARAKNGYGLDPSLWVDWVEYVGPIHDTWPPESHERIFFNGSEAKKDLAYAREIIRRFAFQAFRRKKPADSLLENLITLYSERREAGDSFEEALKQPLSVVLASPSFLYLREPVWKAGTKTISQSQLAVRLSYLLWSEPPDAALYKAAATGQLKTPAGLMKQTNRLLDDPRAMEFISGFTHQWLDMERLDFFQFNAERYPKFDDSVKMASRQEVYRTIESILNEDRPISDLLKADYVVINGLLGDYYGLDVAGDEFQKVSVPADSPRGGLLGMAAIHAMGSDGERSSLVERGAWVMRKLLNDPPPPAPANVPQLGRLENDLLSARQMMAMHTEEPQCAQCHRKIDPIGCGLENFDAAGQWRTHEQVFGEGTKRERKQSKKYLVNARGQLPTGEKFADYFELRDAVAAQDSAFARGFVESLIAYGLGRPFGFTDQDLAEAMVERGAEEGATLRSYVHALVQSSEFHRK